MVFQDGLLFPHLSAVENVAFPLRARASGARGSPAARARSSSGSGSRPLAPTRGRRPLRRRSPARRDRARPDPRTATAPPGRADLVPRRSRSLGAPAADPHDPPRVRRRARPGHARSGRSADARRSHRRARGGARDAAGNPRRTAERPEDRIRRRPGRREPVRRAARAARGRRSVAGHLARRVVVPWPDELPMDPSTVSSPCSGPRMSRCTRSNPKARRSTSCTDRSPSSRRRRTRAGAAGGRAAGRRRGDARIGRAPRPPRRRDRVGLVQGRRDEARAAVNATHGTSSEHADRYA